MKFVDQLNALCKHLEDEFYDDAIKVRFIYDTEMRWLAIGVNHPLWDAYLVQNCILPRLCYKKCIDKMIDGLRLDLRHIDKFIRDNYK